MPAGCAGSISVPTAASVYCVSQAASLGLPAFPTGSQWAGLEFRLGRGRDLVFLQQTQSCR